MLKILRPQTERGIDAHRKGGYKTPDDALAALQTSRISFSGLADSGAVAAPAFLSDAIGRFRCPHVARIRRSDARFLSYPIEYLRQRLQPGRQEGGEEHDRRGTLGPREEGIRRGRPEAHGRASWRGKRSIKTREEGYAITQARGLRGVVRRGRVRPARASFLPIVSAIFIFVI